MRLRLLDLFCGAGGAAVGYHRAGFEVVGVDIEPQPRYPFEFVQADALAFPLVGFDAIHASPPCQAYSALRHGTAGKGSHHPDLVESIRVVLRAAGLPYVIENVPGAPLNHLIVLCGSMFGLGADGRQLRRHRWFEASFPVLSPGCQHRGQAIGVYGNGGRWAPARGGRRGGYQGSADECREAMGIDWMNRAELSQAIPPAYTEHIGGYLLAEIRARQEQAA